MFQLILTKSTFFLRERERTGEEGKGEENERKENKRERYVSTIFKKY